jgi:ABC-type multidrug transport system fused ATPase/permease subunit
LCAISVLLLTLQAFRSLRKRKGKTISPPYTPLPTDIPSTLQNRGIDSNTVSGEYHDEVDDSTSPSLASDDEVAHLLHRSRTHESVIIEDRPQGQLLIVLLEEAAVFGVLVINLIALISGARLNGRIAAAIGVATWGYTFTLASSRLLLSQRKLPFISKLWGHTTFLYLSNFLLLALLFRTVLLHPKSDLSQRLVISEFSLALFLSAIAVSSRKGNRTVKLESVDGSRPSREQTASLFSLATFSWVDTIVWEGYKKKSIGIEDVWGLVPSDKAAYVLQSFRQTTKTTSLVWRLLGHFRWLLFVQASWAALTAVFSLVPTLLLKALLQYIENPGETPKATAWFYVILAFFFTFVQAIVDGQALWLGRKICIRLRAIVVGEVYAKALRRKAAAEADSVLGKEKKGDGKPGLVKRILCCGGRSKKSDDGSTTAESDDDKESSANAGTITNLMAVDSFKVAESSAYIHFLWGEAPIQIIIAVALLFSLLGWSSIVGIIAIICLIPINVVFANKFNELQKLIMAATDIRVHKTNEALTNIRIIKYFAWEQRFQNDINDPRTLELKRLRRRYFVWAFSGCVYFGAPTFITFISFFFYTFVAKNELYPSVAFTAISLFNILRGPLDQMAWMVAEVQEAKVSVDRVDEFLREEETGKYEQLKTTDLEDEFIGFKDATFSWASKTSADQADQQGSNESFRLLDLDVEFPIGKLSIVVGPTGSGKTSLLLALLGEMTLLGGNVYLPGGQSRDDVPADPKTGLKNCVAYCAQSAWLVNDSIQENITFASPWSSRRYKQVISACALERDLEILDAGDQTLVGEKGITLSGGQKQRISLARALYSQAKHILLDDCLSAVDSHTAKWIFQHAFRGDLMKNRTCILVTHNVTLAITASDFIIVMENGRVAAQGAPDVVIASGALGDELKSAEASAQPSQQASRAGSVNGDAESNGTSAKKIIDPEELQKIASVQDADNQQPGGKVRFEETKAIGRVKWPVFKFYLSSMGGIFFWICVLSLFVLQEVFTVAPSVWVMHW